MHKTIYAQYANSPTIVRFVDDYYTDIEKETLLKEFESYVYNVDTAVGFGLDVWGRIVVISRQLEVAGAEKFLGYNEGNVNLDYQPFNQGTFFMGITDAIGTYVLSDTAYRILVLAKAAANIAATTARGLNQVLQAMFPNRGRVYVLDIGSMTMNVVFNFYLTQIEQVILFQSNILPRGAGVGINYVYEIDGKYLGFAEAGYGLTGSALPYNEGVWYVKQPPIK